MSGKKHGRAARKPSHTRYKAEGRREINKAKKQKKIQRMLEKKQARKERKRNENK